MKKFVSYIFLLLLLLLKTVTCVFADNLSYTQEGIVKAVEYVDVVENDFTQTKQVAIVKITKGELKGQEIYAENMLTGNPFYDITLKNNMKVIVHSEVTDGNQINSIEDIKRSNVLIALASLFCLLLVYVGRKKGVLSIVSIALTCVLICNVLSPLILLGINPVLATFLICMLSTALTMYMVGGFNKKSTSATLGCTMSILIAGILSLLTVKFAHINGFINENVTYLYSAKPDLDFVGIVISAMLLATLGAVMDVSMSIASTVNEIFEIDCSKTVKELFKSGMNVGRDIIGTMANTLILVYLGGSLPLLLLASNIDWNKFINLNQVVVEVASALIGSSAIVICVPITAIITSYFIKLKKCDSPETIENSLFEE